MIRPDGKVLRIGADPSVEKNWETCTIAGHCQRHMHPVGKQTALKLDLETKESEGDSVSMDAYEKSEETNAAKEKIDALLKSIDEGIQGVIESGDIEKYLAHISKFHGYSFGNQMLIWIQKPDATQVAGYNKWEEMGRQVKKGERGLDVLAPIMIKKKKTDEQTGIEVEDTVRIGFRGVKVFDISQTEPALHEFKNEDELAAFEKTWTDKGYTVERDDSKPFAAKITQTPTSGAKLLKGEAPPVMTSFIESQISTAGATIQYGNVGGGANGSSEKDNNGGFIIKVRDDVSKAQQIKTLTHELMHIKLGHLERMDEYHTKDGGHRGEMEVAVEALSFMVSKHFGLDSGDYSHGYMAGWAMNNKDKVKRVLQEDVVPFFKEFMKTLPNLEEELPMGTAAAKRRAAKASKPAAKKSAWRGKKK